MRPRTLGHAQSHIGAERHSLQMPTSVFSLNVTRSKHKMSVTDELPSLWATSTCEFIQKKLTPVAPEGPVLGLAQSIQPLLWPSGSPLWLSQSQGRSAITVRTKVIYLSHWTNAHSTTAAALASNSIACALKIHFQSIYLLTNAYLSMLIRTCRLCLSISFIAVQAPICLFGAKAGHAALYFKRVCKHVSEYNSDVCLNQLDCETVGTQKEEHNVCLFVFKLINRQYFKPGWFGDFPDSPVGKT